MSTTTLKFCVLGGRVHRVEHPISIFAQVGEKAYNASVVFKKIFSTVGGA
jgi:hypothetical protein